MASSRTGSGQRRDKFTLVQRSDGGGQITKLKLVKRQMYGRGKIDFLAARVVGVPMSDTTKSASVPKLHAD